MPIAGDFLYFGYRLRTEAPLDGLPRLAPGGTPDIVLTVGEVPDQLENSVWASPFVEINAEGTTLLRLGANARFLVRGGSDIRLDSRALHHMQEAEFFLLGMVAGIVLAQRGDLTLHASCVRIGDCAVAITGVSGRGKSTLAGLLAKQGHKPLTDDVCRIQFADSIALAIPGSAKLRLWPDAAACMGHGAETLAVGRPGHPKRLLVPSHFPTDPVPLAAIVRLDLDLRLRAPTLDRLRGPDTIKGADEIVYRIRMVRRMGRRVTVFQDLARLAGIVPVYRLTRTGDLSDLPELARLAVTTAVTPQ